MSDDPDSLDRLHDLVAPPPVPWWPPAPGWYWVLGALAFIALLWAARTLLRWQHSRYRREALAKLARQEERLRDPAQRPAALVAIAELVKRAALTAWPRRQVASLNGAAWLAFLDQTGGAPRFSTGPGQWLEVAVHDPRQAAALDAATQVELVGHVRAWLIRHQDLTEGQAALGQLDHLPALPPP